MIAKKNDSTYLFDISGCMNYIFQEGLDPEYYKTHYYPDFSGEDNFSIGIRFSENITLLNSADYLYKINNEFAYLSCTITQPTENFIVIEASYKIKTEDIPPDYIKDVQEIFQALMKLSHAKLLVGVSRS